MKTSLTALVLILISCAHVRADDFQGYPIPQSQEDCMQLFKDINKLQAVRHELMDQMNDDTKKMKAGKMSEQKYHRKRVAGLAEEGKYRSSVTLLYDIGYEHGCF